ncbi:hypothetical protein C2845_PM03G02400 [Panicum miliaceum]|uniref:DUF3615 domain-containing protein n=1 Tax=Panicum miliaceum TaxID=4540 RepID=A0A3L6T9N5_PANMI|nr:hypothetical protein C2845_PM03G02400 [Panicum miliaceum]
MDAIQLGRTLPPIPPLPEGYYLTLKNGLFHIHPDELGGPFTRLADATGAIQQKLHPFDNEKAGREQMLRFIKFLSEKDFDLPPTEVSPQPELREDPAEDRCSSADHLEYDPFTLEAIRIFERLEEEEEEIKSGMKWMQAEVTKAFKIYLSSTETRDAKYKFKKLDYQCLIYDSFPKSYHHYNFSMKVKMPSEKGWKKRTYFAEVKSTENGKSYFCCPLQPTDDGMS